jgi:hypothetical protein
MGASIKDPVDFDETVSATEMLVAGSIVEVSINSRLLGRSGSGLGESMES